MGKRYSFVPVFLIAVVTLFIASCSSGLLGAESGTLVIRTGSAVGSKGLTDTWSIGGLPVFSSITPSVTDANGNEMVLDKEPVVSGNTITISVKPGSGLRVAINAVPDWAATATAYGVAESTLPTLAKAYVGVSGPITVKAGVNTAATVALSLSETKIVIPNPAGSTDGQLNTADSITSTALGAGIPLSDLLGYNSDFKFDKYGRLFVTRFNATSLLNEIERYSDLSGTPEVILYGASTYGSVALDDARDRLFYTLSTDGFILQYADFSTNSPAIVVVTLPSIPIDYQYAIDRPVAVDNEGYVYVSAVETTGEIPVILKLSIGAPTAGAIEAAVVASATFESLGLGYTSAGVFTAITIQDMTIVDGKLYLAASDIVTSFSPHLVPTRSRGMVVAIDCATMTSQWKAGWAENPISYINAAKGDSLFYAPATPSSQFYGPRRFVALAPKKLYLIDDGFNWTGARETSSAYSDVDRIVELNTETGTITNVGLDGLSDFFNSYSSIYVS